MKRNPHEFLVDRTPSPLGTLLLVYDRDGHLRALDFADHHARMERLLRVHYAASGYTLRAARGRASATACMAAYFGGELRALEGIVTRTGGTAFQRQVWEALRRIPAGTTTTYGALARTLGRANASRAVGLANGANPIGIVVPCHRVIAADGALTGYAGGIERKRWLLSHERQWSATRAAVPWCASA